MPYIKKEDFEWMDTILDEMHNSIEELIQQRDQLHEYLDHVRDRKNKE